METSFFLNLPGGRVHCRRFGGGSRLLIALHGFGDSGAEFMKLPREWRESYAICALDLPFHGDTEWKKKEYTPADIAAIVEALLAREQRSTFTWMGFSLGGRLVLATLDRFLDRLDAVILLAPDGLGTRGMALPHLVPLPLRRLVAERLRDPRWLLQLAGQFRKSGKMPPIQHRLLRYYLSNDRRRRCLFGTWRSLAAFRVPRVRLRRLLQAQPVPMTIILGSEDRLVPAGAVRRFARGLPTVWVEVKEGGHWGVVG